MKRISSKGTFFYKRVFPLFWFGFIAFIVIIVLLTSGRTHAAPIPFLVAPVVMAAFGYALLRKLVFDLADAVGTTATNPGRVTLALREPGRFGKEISFSPARRFLAFARSPVINELIERVDAARRGSS